MSLLTAPALAAEKLVNDPTQPPTFFLAPQPGDGPVAGGNRLHFIKIPESGAPFAMIDGQLVPLGGKIGNARLVRLTASSATLEGPAGKETLRLTPGIQKTDDNQAARRTKEKL